jgi:hypothetical protein
MTSPRKRCKVCDKKVGLDYYPCKCDSEAVFCSVHRFSWDHKCKYDAKESFKSKLETSMEKIVAKKFETI